jgi:two-component system sensor histidine kinase/response regulator
VSAATPASAGPAVLLVDDRPANLLALAAVLAPLGYELIRAGSGEEALGLLLERDVALIILDVQMPSLDGFETAELIRARPRTEHVPLIFLTAIDGEREHRIRGYEQGAVDYICKPFDPGVLRAKVRVLVQLWEQQQLIGAQRGELARRLDELDHAYATLTGQADELERSNAALRGFAEAMANELREPLYTLAGLADLLSERHGAALPAEGRELAGRSAAAARALGGRLDSLLEFARVSTDGLAPTNVPLIELVERAHAELRLPLEATTVEPAGLAGLAVRGDRRQLCLLLAAMLRHAAGRAAPPAAPRLEASAAGGSVLVSLADDGPPLDPAAVGQLFGLFPSPERADPARPSGALALARRIAERHAGELWWDPPATDAAGDPATEPGAGAALRLRLPAAG